MSRICSIDVEIEIPRRGDESNSVPLNISTFISRNRDTPKRKRKHIHLMPIRQFFRRNKLKKIIESYTYSTKREEV